MKQVPVWKTAHVAPVYKKGPKYNPENYRPISLTCICCKLLEQFRSCETQLIEFIDDVTRNLDDGKQTDVLIMDFSKAFDKVNHNLLIHMLKHFGIRGKVNNWIERFLSSRTQAVIVEGEKFTYLPVDSGGPPGLDP